MFDSDVPTPLDVILVFGNTCRSWSFSAQGIDVGLNGLVLAGDTKLVASCGLLIVQTGDVQALVVVA